MPGSYRSDGPTDSSGAQLRPPGESSVTKQQNNLYRAAFETHHVAHIEEFDSYEAAAKFLHGWSRDVHTWPVAIHEPAENRLWLWCGYRTLGVSRASALEEVRGIFGLPQDYVFAAVEMMREDV